MFPQFHVGFRAGISHAGNSMRIAFSPHETGPDSGVTHHAADAGSLSYAVYLPTAAAQDLKLPGSGKPVGPDAPVRAPGWNSVRVGERFTLNGTDWGHGEPGNLGCYLTGPRAPGHVCLTSWVLTDDPLAAPPAAPPHNASFRFAD